MFTSPTAVPSKPNFFNEGEVSKILSQVNNLPYFKGILNGQESEDNPKLSQTRKSSVKWIPQSEEWVWLWAKLVEEIQLVNSLYWRFKLSPIEDWVSIQYTEYNSNEEGHYDWHVDVGENVSSYRKVSCTIQLSSPEEYEGGDLQVNTGKIETLPKDKGAICLFPSYILHRVTPVTRGIRKSLVLWVGGKPYS